MAKRKAKKAKKTKRLFGLKPYQATTLAVLALLDCLVIAMMGFVVVRATLNANNAPAVAATVPAEAENAAVSPTPAPPTATPEPPPPTWTPQASPTPVGMESLYTFVPAECSFEIPAGANVECGFVGVPETRDDSPSTQIVQLAVAIYRSPDPVSDPVIFLTGGPGGDVVGDSDAMYEDFIAPLLAERDFIAFDQRGTGLSKPNLECWEYASVIEDDLDKNYSPEQRSEAYPRALRNCHNRLISEGTNPAAYTSAANAADVKDLARSLGYERASLYGASYGTRLALTVMRDHPEVVSSVVLDAVEPVEILLYNRMAASADRLLNKIFEGCAADPGCRAAYPNLEAKYYDLVERLDTYPVELWTRMPGEKMYRIQLSGTWLTRVIFSSSYTSEAIAFMPRVIHDTYNGDYTLMEWILTLGVSAETDISIGMSLSVNCHEEAFATTPQQLAVDYAAYPHLENFANAAVYGTPATLFTICEEWGAAPFDPLEGEPVASDIPTLVLAGEYDPITPPEYARQVAEHLSNSFYYEFPGQGHGVGMWQSPCAAEIMRTFLHDPSVAPDAGCIADMEGPDFFY